jgi:hypothetical protein
VKGIKMNDPQTVSDHPTPAPVNLAPMIAALTPGIEEPDGDPEMRREIDAAIDAAIDVQLPRLDYIARQKLIYLLQALLADQCRRARSQAAQINGEIDP